MKEILDYLNGITFYLATVDGNIPKVRPFGFVMEFEGKLYFATSNNRDVYRQLKANPNFEVCTASTKQSWIRISGKAVFDTRHEVLESVYDKSAFFKEKYEGESNPELSMFYIEDGSATFYNFDSSPRTVNI